MKIRSLLLLLLFLSTHTVYANENPYTEVSSEACNSTYNLPNNQWRQVSLPCTPEGDGSVSEVFGDDIAEIFVAGTPSYDTDWVVYKYDPSIYGGYTKLTESDTLSVGVGYWIIQQSGGDATLDLPLNSIHAPAIQSDVCSSSNGCFEIQLKANTDAVRWNMIGRPFGFISRLGGCSYDMM